MTNIPADDWERHAPGRALSALGESPAVAAPQDDVLEALDLSPERFRTEGGFINKGKLRAAILHPADYLPPEHWLQADVRVFAQPPLVDADDLPKAMWELLTSAKAIADRKGEGTAWERFSASVAKLGITGVTARTYRILPSDEQPPSQEAAHPVAWLAGGTVYALHASSLPAEAIADLIAEPVENWQPLVLAAHPVGAGVRQDDEVHQGGAPATTLPLDGADGAPSATGESAS